MIKFNRRNILSAFSLSLFIPNFLKPKIRTCCPAHNKEDREKYPLNIAPVITSWKDV